MKKHVITILGGGWSAMMVNLEKLPGHIIAVNDAATYAPRWDDALTMDRLWAENRIDFLARRIAEPNTNRRAFFRQNALQNLANYRQLWPFVEPFECDHESTIFTTEDGRLNGTNSGMCALNLAWKYSPRTVYLVGFDMNRSPRGQPYWYPPYPWVEERGVNGATTDGKYSRWSQQFADAAKAFALIKCAVYNVSATSAIKDFRRITPAELARIHG